MNQDGPDAPVGNASAIEFKRIMAAGIQRFIDDNPLESKKSVAMSLGHTQADLSHWLSPHTSFTMPGHLVPDFCSLVADNTLIWHLQTRYEGLSMKKATDSAVA